MQHSMWTKLSPATYGTTLAGLHGNTFAGPGTQKIGGNAFLWEDPASLQANMSPSWWTSSPVKAAGVGLAALIATGAVAYGVWTIIKD